MNLTAPFLAADFYQNRFREYFTRTVTVDPAPFLTPLTRNLESGAAVLDVGCGSGRDLLWLKERGFKPVGFERSPGLADLARAHSGCRVITGDFEHFDFSAFSVAAVMACGSLVHVPHQRLSPVIRHILQALSPGGFFYVSLKKGENTKVDNSGRTFYLWEPEQLADLLPDLGLTIRHVSASRSALNSKDDWLAWVLRLTP